MYRITDVDNNQNFFWFDSPKLGVDPVAYYQDDLYTVDPIKAIVQCLSSFENGFCNQAISEDELLMLAQHFNTTNRALFELQMSLYLETGHAPNHC